MSRQHRAYIGLGSNLGERNDILNGAVESLNDRPLIEVTLVSSFIETDPVGGPPQPPYLNGAAEMNTVLSPIKLLYTLHDIEQDFGRERLERWGPRTLDLDLLLYEQQIIDTNVLTVPHPRLHTRRFVLEPLNEIAPHALHPILNKTVESMLETLET